MVFNHNWVVLYIALMVFQFFILFIMTYQLNLWQFWSFWTNNQLRGKCVFVKYTFRTGSCAKGFLRDKVPNHVQVNIEQREYLGTADAILFCSIFTHFQNWLILAWFGTETDLEQKHLAKMHIIVLHY